MWEYCKSIPFNVQPLHTQVCAENLLFCFSNNRDPGQRTVETSSISGSCLSRKLSALQLCHLTPIPAGLRDPLAAWEEGVRVLFIQPWPKLGLHNLSKNNRERARQREEERDTVCAHMRIGPCAEWRNAAHLLYGNLSVCVCLCVYFQRREGGGVAVGLSTLHPRICPSAGRRGSRRPT